MSKLNQVNDKNFETEVVAAELPVLVEFGASWCGPCTRQLPILETFAEQNVDTVKVVQVDIDETTGITNKLGIKSVPTLVVFRSGVVVATKVGLTSLTDLEQLVQKQ